MSRAFGEVTRSRSPQANLVVEPTCETHDGLDVDHNTKRYKNRSKKGVETSKGIFSRYYISNEIHKPYCNVPCNTFVFVLYLFSQRTRLLLLMF